MNKNLLKSGIFGFLGAFVSLWIMYINGLFSGENLSASQVYNVLCDAFFVPGILFILFGVLFCIAKTGLFDSLGYAFSTAKYIFIPFAGTEKRTFYDYKKEKEEKRRPVPFFIFGVGAGYVLVSIIFLIFYLKA